jgi:hypothetical protein
VVPKQNRDVSVMGRGSTDETVVVVKLLANEDVVTCLRVKLSASDRKLFEAKGGTYDRGSEVPFETIIMSSAIFGAIVGLETYFSVMQWIVRNVEMMMRMGEVK